VTPTRKPTADAKVRIKAMSSGVMPSIDG
jgi:hypothetical protein